MDGQALLGISLIGAIVPVVAGIIGMRLLWLVKRKDAEIERLRNQLRPVAEGPHLVVYNTQPGWDEIPPVAANDG